MDSHFLAQMLSKTFLLLLEDTVKSLAFKKNSLKSKSTQLPQKLEYIWKDALSDGKKM